MQNAIYSLGSENRTAGTKNVEHLEESSHTENNVYVATGPAGQFSLTQHKATRTRASQSNEGCAGEQVSESRNRRNGHNVDHSLPGWLYGTCDECHSSNHGKL